MAFDFFDNPLSYYENVSYRMKLFLIHEENSLVLSDIVQQGQNFDSFLEAAPKIVIGETGSTTLNIQDVEMTSIVAANPETLLTTGMKIQMRLFEPMGLSFIDKLLLASKELGITNYLRTPYYLELSFHGYDSRGNYIPLIGPQGAGDGRKWYYRLVVTNVSTEFTPSGTFYDMSFKQFDDMASMDFYFRLANNFTAQAGSVKDVFDNIVEHKKEEEIRNYGYQRNFYEFNFVNLESQMGDIDVVSRTNNKLDPTAWEYRPVETEGNRDGDYEDTNRKELSFNRGQSIESIVKNVFAATKEGQNLMNRTTEKDNVGNESEFVIYWSIEPETHLRGGQQGYDYIANDYNRIIKYNIVPKISPRTTGSEKQLDPVRNRDKRELSRKFIERYNTGIVKRYDYLFTGLNTEILELNINLDTLWHATVPVFSGARDLTYNTPGPVEADQGNYLSRDETLIKLRSLRKSERQLNQLREDLRADGQANNPEMRRFERAAERMVQDRRQEAGQSRVDFNRQQFNVTNNKTKGLIEKLYLEERSGARTSGFLPITIDRSPNEEDQTASGNASSTGTTISQSITTALLNQLSDHKNLLKIDLTVRGDPYWLGFTHLERARVLSTGPNGRETLAAYAKKEIHFLLTFKIPQGLDEGGEPILIKDEKFTGIYIPIRVVSKFSEGAFTQTLHSTREYNIDINPILEAINSGNNGV